MKKVYSKEVKLLIAFNLIFVIVGLVFVPMLDKGVILNNIILGVCTVVDICLILLLICRREKLDKASASLLLLSFAAVFTVIYKWITGSI